MTDDIVEGVLAVPYSLQYEAGNQARIELILKDIFAIAPLQDNSYEDLGVSKRTSLYKEVKNELMRLGFTDVQELVGKHTFLNVCVTTSNGDTYSVCVSPQGSHKFLQEAELEFSGYRDNMDKDFDLPLVMYYRLLTYLSCKFPSARKLLLIKNPTMIIKRLDEGRCLHRLYVKDTLYR